MKTINLDKTLELCRKAWEKAQYDNKWKFVIFEPVLMGENVDFEKIKKYSFNTGFEEEPFMVFDIRGFDDIEGRIDWSLEAKEASLSEQLGLKFNDFYKLENGDIEVSEEQKKIIENFKNETIETTLDYYWHEEGKENETKEYIFQYAEDNGYKII